MFPLDLAAAALIAGLLALERKAFLQASASRPLVAGTLLGLALGHPVEGLTLGAALELFFLGGVNLGAALPDNELFATVSAVCCASGLLGRSSLSGEAVMALSVFLALGTAKLGRTTDRLSERVNSWAASHAEVNGGLDSALRFNLFGLWVPFLTTAGLALAGELAGARLLPTLAARVSPSADRALTGVWIFFWVVACASALRAVRTRRAALYGLLAATFAAGGTAARLLLL